MFGYELRLQPGPYTCTRFDVLNGKSFAPLGDEPPGWGNHWGPETPFGDIRVGAGYLQCAWWAEPGDMLPRLACQVNRLTDMRPWLTECNAVGQVVSPDWSGP